MSTDLRTELNDCDNVTGFAGDGGSPSLNTLTGQRYEGSGSIDTQHSDTQEHMWTTQTSGGGGTFNVDMSDMTVYLMVKDNLVDTYANGGVEITLGDGTDDIGYDVGGNDGVGLAISPFFNAFKIDVSELAGTPGGFTVYAGVEANLTYSAITRVGYGSLHLAKAQGNVANVFLDRITYIANDSPALRINGGTSGTPETMADVQGDDVTNGWAMISNPVGAQFGFFAPTQWGEPSANADAYFEAIDEQWYWIGDNAGGRALGATHFPFSLAGNATDTISFVLTRVVIVNTGTRAQFDMSDADVDTMQLEAVTFDGLGALTFPTVDAGNKFANDCIFNNCDQVDFQSIDADGCVFNGTTNADGAIIWDADDNSEQNQDNLELNSDGTGHAIHISIDDALASTFDISGYTFDGYAGQSGTAGNRVFFIENPSDGDITINLTDCQALNVVGGGSGFSYELAAGTTSTVSIVQTVSVTITVVDEAGDPIEGAKVFLEEDPGGTDVISYDITDLNGEVTTTYSGSTPQAVTGFVRKTQASPVYKSVPINDTIGSTGLSATVTMVADE